MPKFVSAEDYLTRANTIHNNKYQYDVATLRSANHKIPIICPIHGAFHQKLANHLNGAGCPQCAGRGVDWVTRFREVHGNTYDYKDVIYKGYKNPVRILCHIHGAFNQTPDNHYRGRQGCSKCKGDKLRRARQMPIKVFLQQAIEIHKGAFEYIEAQFDNVLTGTVTMICKQHNYVCVQTPVNHLSGKNPCPQCNNMKSKGEDAVADYLATFTRVIRRDRTIIAPKELDIVLPDVKIAIEYCGSYHHSVKSMDAEKAHKLKHYQKHILAQAAGYRLITIFDYEWETRQKTIKRLLRNAIGKAKGRLMARKCEMRKVSVSEARKFYDKYHPQGGAGSGEHYGLYWKDKLVACMRFVHGANDRGANHQREWTLGRYATRVNVAGAASKLFKAFLAEYNPPVVKSFSDNRLFSGRMYEQLGFTLAVESSPDYQVWSPKLGVRPKSHYQRRLLQKRIEDHGSNDTFNHKTDTRTEAQITYSLGCGRLYDCGKKKWVYNNP